MTYGVRDFGGRRIELCDECGFDGRNARAEREDIRAAFAALQQLTTHTDAGRRPAPQTWSAIEYVAHSVEVTRILIQMASMALGRDEPAAPGDLQDAGAAAIAFADSLSAGDREGPGAGVPV